MSDLSDFQERALAVGVAKLLTGNHFSICDLDTLLKVVGKPAGGRDYEALRALHCVDWRTMGEPLAAQVREKCLELLGLPPQCINVVAEVVQDAKPSAHAHAKSSGLLRLILGQRG